MITTLNNLDVVITGTLSKMTRKTAFDRIRSEGGFPRKKISGNTDLLVIGQLRWISEKLSFADDNYIDTITEDEFYEMIGEL
jgi:NAD-dependent DNA ligase